MCVECYNHTDLRQQSHIKGTCAKCTQRYELNMLDSEHDKTAQWA